MRCTNSRGFQDKNGLLNLGQNNKSDCNQQKKKKKKKKKKENMHNLGLYRPGGEQSEKKDKYLDLARELKNLCNTKVTIIPIVIVIVTKGLVQGLEDLEITGRMETIQTTALLRLERILKSVLETREDLLSLELLWETIC